MSIKSKRSKIIAMKRKSQLPASHGKRVRLHRLLYRSGPANGTLMILPLDQGVEHGPTDFFPNPDALDLHEPKGASKLCPEPYRSLREQPAQSIRRVVRSAGRCLVLFSGGEKLDDDAAVLRKVQLYMEGGATGVIFGRNLWLRPLPQALELSRSVHAVMQKHSR